MKSIKIDFDAHIEASGPLDIPAGSDLVFDDAGTLIGHITAEDQRVAHRGHEAAMATATTEPPAATPAAVAHADELGVDLTQVQGTGVDGTITKPDVAAAAEQPPA